MIVHLTLKQLFIFPKKCIELKLLSSILQQESNKINFACRLLVFRLGNSLSSAQRKQVRYDRLPLVRDTVIQSAQNIINQYIYRFYSYVIGFICPNKTQFSHFGLISAKQFFLI